MYKKGDVLKCINATAKLKLNAEYVVSSERFDDCVNLIVDGAETKGYYANRFVLVKDVNGSNVLDVQASELEKQSNSLQEEIDRIESEYETLSIKQHRQKLLKAAITNLRKHGKEWK